MPAGSRSTRGMTSQRPRPHPRRRSRRPRRTGVIGRDPRAGRRPRDRDRAGRRGRPLRHDRRRVARPRLARPASCQGQRLGACGDARHGDGDRRPLRRAGPVRRPGSGRVREAAVDPDLRRRPCRRRPPSGDQRPAHRADERQDRGVAPEHRRGQRPDTVRSGPVDGPAKEAPGPRRVAATRRRPRSPSRRTARPIGSRQTWPMIAVRPPASTDSATRPSRWRDPARRSTRAAGDPIPVRRAVEPRRAAVR